MKIPMAVIRPPELARTAKAEGYGAVAVTDHDTVTKILIMHP